MVEACIRLICSAERTSFRSVAVILRLRRRMARASGMLLRQALTTSIPSRLALANRQLSNLCHSRVMTCPFASAAIHADARETTESTVGGTFAVVAADASAVPKLARGRASPAAASWRREIFGIGIPLFRCSDHWHAPGGSSSLKRRRKGENFRPLNSNPAS